MDNETNTVPTLNPLRIYIQLQDFPTLRLQPHKDNEDLVVAKCKNPEGIDMALRAALIANGHDPEKVGAQIPDLILERLQGKVYAIAVLSRDTASLLAQWGAESLFKPPAPVSEDEHPLAEHDKDADDELDL